VVFHKNFDLPGALFNVDYRLFIVCYRLCVYSLLPTVYSLRDFLDYSLSYKAAFVGTAGSVFIKIMGKPKILSSYKFGIAPQECLSFDLNDFFHDAQKN